MSKELEQWTFERYIAKYNFAERILHTAGEDFCNWQKTQDEDYWHIFLKTMELYNSLREDIEEQEEANPELVTKRELGEF